MALSRTMSKRKCFLCDNFLLLLWWPVKVFLDWRDCGHILKGKTYSEQDKHSNVNVGLNRMAEKIQRLTHPNESQTISILDKDLQFYRHKLRQT